VTYRFPERVFGSAEFSACGAYRFELTRSWDAKRRAVAFVMLNPSTADAAVDDPTIRRCIRFADEWGYGELRVYNIFALRATDPSELWRHVDPIGAGNNAWIAKADQCARIVCAWGSFDATGCPHLADRGKAVAQLILRYVDLYALATNQDGAPRHPLYVRASTQPQLWAKAIDTTGGAA
jgi:hypothetical protein